MNACPSSGEIHMQTVVGIYPSYGRCPSFHPVNIPVVCSWLPLLGVSNTHVLSKIQTKYFQLRYIATIKINPNFFFISGHSYNYRLKRCTFTMTISRQCYMNTCIWIEIGCKNVITNVNDLKLSYCQVNVWFIFLSITIMVERDTSRH